MLSPVPNSRRAFAAQASKLSGTGPRDDEIRLLRRAALEYSSALEHEAARFPCNAPDDPLEADERGRAVAAVHHQVFDNGVAKESYFVIPGSGTGELRGLRGEGTSAVGHGTEHPLTLNYELG